MHWQIAAAMEGGGCCFSNYSSLRDHSMAIFLATKVLVTGDAIDCDKVDLLML